MNSRILITGATGFIGRHLLEKLLNSNNYVRCFVRNKNTITHLNGRFEIFEGDLLNFHDCFDALKDIDIVYHIAGLGLSRLKQNPVFNEVSTKTLLEAAIKHDRKFKFIYVSSIKAVGPSSKGKINENQKHNPTDNYGISKAKAEEEILRINSKKITRVIIRPPAVYGPGDRNLLPLFKLMKKGYQLKLLGTKLNYFSMVYVEDLADCLLKIPSLSHTSDIVNISHTDIHNWNEFFDLTNQISERKVKRIYLPLKITYYLLLAMSYAFKVLDKQELLPLSRVNDLLNYNWCVDTTKLSKIYGLSCNTSLTEGVKKTYYWYKENGWL
ncbi:nucleoside-diphosphate-sugar epimerase [Thermolongibacillus altinsuensis]|uniref:Nucleoside-diphosphate-sugar epimerase n=1 Tax=Thermolongibacillus altinsuensis TaxID=575256 RepID=A0A4R1Q8M1_9BACL|nr:NAD-dependent epimerase/dehydratase family protein [Thermolongibacillus altinsuensis]TCL43368.1 nucleoside-diphosphate-sugar epimerase [Thermolongibacillus altinsuensis]